jgi:hypothetical protein
VSLPSGECNLRALALQAQAVEQRRHALHSEPTPVFQMVRFPEANQLVSWTGQQDGGKSMCVLYAVTSGRGECKGSMAPG